MHRLMTPEEFASRAKDDLFPAAEAALYRLAPAQADLTDIDSRIVRYVFSTGAVARDGHTINPDGWDFSGFDNYRSFLWAHDSSEPPIGNVINHDVRNQQLVGAVKYVEREIYPFADMIFQMVKQRIISAVSVSWRPLEWKWSTDRNRPGGIDFIRQDCLEISQVPVPCQPVAIATARAQGIDTTPMVEWAERILDGGGMVAVPRATLEQWRRDGKMATSKKQRTGAADWKCGASRDLTVGDDKAWDGPEASKRIFDHAGFDGDKPDAELARSAFLFFDAANPDLKGSYKEPFADVVDGKLVAMPAGIRAAASRLPGTDGPSDSVKDEAKAVIAHYEDKAKEGDKTRSQKRGLYEVASLTWMLQELGWLQNNVEIEADIEGDGSDLPARLAKLLNDAGLILVDMTKEEVGELLAVISDKETGQIEEALEQAAKTSGQRALVRLMRLSRKAAAPAMAIRAAMAAEAISMLRAGKVLSGANKDTLTRAMEHHTATGDCIRQVLNAADTGADSGDPDDDTRRAQRERELAMLSEA